MTQIEEAIAFVGSALAPFFLEDPQKGKGKNAFEAMRVLDVAAAVQEWPFGKSNEVREGLALMQEGLSAGIEDDELMWEYRRLFVGPGHLDCPPWGSVYTDRESVIFGESTTALRAWMRAHAIERSIDDRSPEDHVGLMLALMAYLAQEHPELLDDYLELHFLTWIPHYLDALERASRHDFYRGLALLTRTTLQGIQEDRGLTVELPRFYR